MEKNGILENDESYKLQIDTDSMGVREKLTMPPLCCCLWMATQKTTTSDWRQIILVHNTTKGK